MVPGSTFRYGSNFIRFTFSPRLSSKHPNDAAAKPLPNEETTPPVTKMYLADIDPRLITITNKGAQHGTLLPTSVPLIKLWIEFVRYNAVGVHIQLCQKSGFAETLNTGRTYAACPHCYPHLIRYSRVVKSKL